MLAFYLVFYSACCIYSYTLIILFNTYGSGKY
uniref:Uncharacterized protein n=1 Tax=Rhizophora mucronata TaxID=61149 RepID=A0A2P2P8U1_RHIMU